MNFVVNRIVGDDDLLRRPRVSYRLSEYVVYFIDENILKAHRILQSDKYIYNITFSFSFEIPKEHKIIYKGLYSTDSRLYIPMPGFRVFEKVNKNIFLSVTANDIDQNISQKDYAILLYRMFAEYLLFNFKKLTKREFDDFEDKLDFSLFDTFPFPADFSDQRYIENNENMARQKYVQHYGR